MSGILLKISLGALGGTVFAGTAYIVGITYATPEKIDVTDDMRMATFNTIAPNYENGTCAQEWYLGIRRMRKNTAMQARGRVLEVGAGTGHNVGLYDPEHCSEIVMTDGSPRMIDMLRQKVKTKLNQGVNEYDEKSAYETVVDTPASMLIEEDPNQLKKKSYSKKSSEPERGPLQYSVGTFRAEKLPFADSSFDTVVDMFGLCSYIDPSLAMKEMVRVCKPTGKILMIEHGKGRKERINNYLEKWAMRHASKWGCWWNRDIRRYVRLSGAKVISQNEKHFGTTIVYVLSPGSAKGALEAKK